VKSLTNIFFNSITRFVTCLIVLFASRLSFLAFALPLIVTQFVPYGAALNTQLPFFNICGAIATAFVKTEDTIKTYRWVLPVTPASLVLRDLNFFMINSKLICHERSHLAF
jgi:hypothetical protein